MNDFFYFSALDIDVEDLHVAISGIEQYSSFLSKNEKNLQIEVISNDKNVRWDIYEMNIDEDFSDAGSLNTIKESGAVSCFCVSHHSWTLNELGKLFMIFISIFGGWVGNDSDGFEPKFTLENISFLSY